MKRSKRMICRILVLMLLFSISICAFAADNVVDIEENPANTTIDTNTGTINVNNGTVENNIQNNALNPLNNGVIKTNNGTVTNNGSMSAYGKIGTNSATGEVVNNYDVVDENNGDVLYNRSEGSGGIVNTNNDHVGVNDNIVWTNNGLVDTNNRKVDVNGENGEVGINGQNSEVRENKGTVDYNNGTVVSNSGTVDYNTVDGNVTNTADGTVTDNYGYVDNTAGGTVTNNYGYEETSDGTYVGVEFLDTDGNDGSALKQFLVNATEKLGDIFSRRGYKLRGYRNVDEADEIEGDEFTTESPQTVVLLWDKLPANNKVLRPYTVGDVSESTVYMIYDPAFRLKVTEDRIQSSKVSVDGQKLGDEAYEIGFNADTMDFSVSFTQDFLGTLSAGSHTITIVVLGFTYNIQITI